MLQNVNYKMLSMQQITTSVQLTCHDISIIKCLSEKSLNVIIDCNILTILFLCLGNFRILLGAVSIINNSILALLHLNRFTACN